MIVTALLAVATAFGGSRTYRSRPGASQRRMIGEGRSRNDGHPRAAHTAISDGADLRANLVWSLPDDFEWHDGYRRRSGIVHVDFQTRHRLPGDSGLWY
ncbi:hypothetical protein GCM10022226_57900 [Sphaerisporangium flaviroseum]|uniref:Uncharacterized protein n=1 Tax=Sphaerisporangium flaviroseum TaxID=509199 RepID=A0ABP7IXG2_9ACTN